MPNGEPVTIHPGQVTSVLQMELDFFPVPASQDLTGETVIGSVALHGIPGIRCAVWEMGVGAIRDVETDELFVVLSGRASVEILPTAGFDASVVELSAGSVMTVSTGMHTIWTVMEPLRKVFLTLTP